MLTKLVFAAAALIFTTTGFSQDLPKTKDAYKRKEFNLPSMDQPIVIKDRRTEEQRSRGTEEQMNRGTREEFLQRIRVQREGQYSHSTLNGKVMILPPDNMPCLVPDKKNSAAIPIWKPKQNLENMPNGIKPYKNIPDKKE